MLNMSDETVTGACYSQCYLGDGSARAATKVVASCDKPRGGACSLRTADCRMGNPGRRKRLSLAVATTARAHPPN